MSVLTHDVWMRTFDRYRKLTPTSAQAEEDLFVVTTMANMLYDIVGTVSDDPRIGQILDSYALGILEKP